MKGKVILSCTMLATLLMVSGCGSKDKETVCSVDKSKTTIVEGDKGVVKEVKYHTTIDLVDAKTGKKLSKKQLDSYKGQEKKTEKELEKMVVDQNVQSLVTNDKVVMDEKELAKHIKVDVKIHLDKGNYELSSSIDMEAIFGKKMCDYTDATKMIDGYKKEGMTCKEN